MTGKPYIIAISGWRGWSDAAFIEETLVSVAFQEDITSGVHFRIGDQEGADKLSAAAVGAIGFIPSLYVAKWALHGAGAGPRRSGRMLLGEPEEWETDPTAGRKADTLIAFPQPGRAAPASNSGTWRAIYIAAWHGIDVQIPGYGGREGSIRG